MPRAVKTRQLFKMRRQRMRASNRGKSRRRGFVFGALLVVLFLFGVVVLGYLGYRVLPCYYRSLEVKQVMQEEARDFGFHGDSERTKRDIAEALKKRFEIDMDLRDIYIEKKEKQLFVDGFYVEEVPVLWGKMRLTFEPSVVIAIQEGVKIVP